jgi:hypothetical protein
MTALQVEKLVNESLFRAKDESAPITVIALSPLVPFHLGKVKSSTSALTCSF